MHEALSHIRAQLASTLHAVDRLLADHVQTAVSDTLLYRTVPGGPLSELGIEEMYRRFALGEPDAVIARAMGVSVQGVQKRRTLWKASGNV